MDLLLEQCNAWSGGWELGERYSWVIIKLAILILLGILLHQLHRPGSLLHNKNFIHRGKMVKYMMHLDISTNILDDSRQGCNCRAGVGETVCLQSRSINIYCRTVQIAAISKMSSMC